jgi:hypothetical protein
MPNFGQLRILALLMKKSQNIKKRWSVEEYHISPKKDVSVTNSNFKHII